MTNFRNGRKAEAAAANYLRMRGFEIIEMNWRRPRCEIDIIAKKDDVIFFVEVKYRQDLKQGGGLEYITPTKLRQMRYGAESWTEENEYAGVSQLAAIEVMGPDFAVTSFIENAY